MLVGPGMPAIPLNPQPSWKIRIEARAKRAAAKPGMRRYPRRFILFGPRIVTLETFLRAEALSHRNFQKDINRLTILVHSQERGIARRQKALDAAAEYIDILKARVRAYHPDYGPLYGTDAPEHKDASAGEPK